jgi:outer membrane protein OmpA-like peptidoglycan-associated protein
MQRKDSVIAVALLAASIGFGNAAFAQTDPGQPLLQPGEGSSADQPIHLHMPTTEPAAQPSQHRVHRAARKPLTAAGVVTTAPAAKSRKHAATGLAAVPPASGASAPIPFSFGDDIVPPSSAPVPVPSPTGRPAPAHVTSASPARQASFEPAKADTGDRAHLTKHGAVLFDKGVSDPSPAQFTGVKVLASDLSSALQAGSARVQLEAYGGAPGDKSSDARRLSLKRALAVRQLLIDDGLPSSRIDVRAMGGIDDKGPADRVDVFVRAG